MLRSTMARAACPRLGVLMLVWGFTAAFGALYPYFVRFDNYSYPGLWLILLWPSAVYFLFSYFYFFDGYNAVFSVCVISQLQ